MIEIDILEDIIKSKVVITGPLIYSSDIKVLPEKQLEELQQIKKEIKLTEKKILKKSKVIIENVFLDYSDLRFLPSRRINQLSNILVKIENTKNGI